MTDDLERAQHVASQWHLGQTSAHYESGGDVGTISTGKHDKGGVSYGAYQLSSASGTLREYLDQSPYGAQFQGLTPVTPAFNAKWQTLARTDPGFGEDQQRFVGQSHYSQQVAALEARGIDLSDRGMAVQDALWSTSVQCRGLTPRIFDKGLQEKFGQHYDLATLSDKDIVGAVQDYKTAHVETLFAGSPHLHDSLKARFAHERVALEALAGADATLAANGVTVPHVALPTSAAPSQARGGLHPHAGHGHPPVRLHDHGAPVVALQQQLSALHYRGVEGRPLEADGHFGPATQAAVEAFQRDQHLHVDGVAGARTMNALQAALPPPVRALDHQAHPGHSMYTRVFRLVQDLDAQQGRTSDQMSANLAGALSAQSRAAGMTQIDHLALSEDASKAYVIQGDLHSPFKQYASVDVAQAVVQPLDRSSHAWMQAQQQQQQMAAPTIEAPQQAPTAPTMSR
ncbi:peptidoglycan-binding domain-containing protein [Luteibacter sp. PPL201]|uniref:Peptidoglycan-binding domain-containing protein n=1 Tax=Luteibacter sahnii TaxID=3021977 RepID=A0ABT6B7F6_9GAMM